MPRQKKKEKNKTLTIIGLILFGVLMGLGTGIFLATSKPIIFLTNSKPINTAIVEHLASVDNGTYNGIYLISNFSGITNVDTFGCRSATQTSNNTVILGNCNGLGKGNFNIELTFTQN